MNNPNPYLLMQLTAEVEQISLFSFRDNPHSESSHFWGIVIYGKHDTQFQSITAKIPGLKGVLSVEGVSQLYRIIDFTHKRTFKVRHTICGDGSNDQFIAYYYDIQEEIIIDKEITLTKNGTLL